MSVRLVCQICKDEITPDRSGHLWINQTSAELRLRILEEAGMGEHPNAALHMASKSNPPLPWHASHQRCAYMADSGGLEYTEAKEGVRFYTIGAVLPLTVGDLLRWNELINKESWAAHTDWNEMLAKATTSRTRIVIEESA